MKKDKIACIILNYNDAKTSLELVRKIEKYKNIDNIILVDNASVDNSVKLIRKYINNKEKIELIENKKNVGYGGGNNFGIKYAKFIRDCKYAIVANPDVEFDEDSINKMYKSFLKNKNLACVSPIMLMNEKRAIDSLNYPPAFPLRPWFLELLELLPLSRRVFHKKLAYSKKFYKKDRNLIKVCALAGSLLMLDIDKFLEVGAYDEAVFLYCEESILAKKFEKYSYETAILSNTYYKHKHSISIKKEFKSILKRQKLREDSTMYYFKKYLGINKTQEYISQLIFYIIRLEIYISIFIKSRILK